MAMGKFLTAVPSKIQNTKLSTVVGRPENGRRKWRNGRLFSTNPTRVHRLYIILLVCKEIYEPARIVLYCINKGSIPKNIAPI